ncbi:hypothetical protein ABZP36_031457 [Zizania latifolia]
MIQREREGNGLRWDHGGGDEEVRLREGGASGRHGDGLTGEEESGAAGSASVSMSGVDPGLRYLGLKLYSLRLQDGQEPGAERRWYAAMQEPMRNAPLLFDRMAVRTTYTVSTDI